MNLQKINVKLFTDAPAHLLLDSFLDIFARWRHDTSNSTGWIDLADYAHVRQGPGIMLIGTEGNFSIDLALPGPGILYTNKRNLEGSDEDRILQTFRRSLRLIAALTLETDFPAQLKPRTAFWEIAFNDRLDAPNTDQTEQRLQPAVHAVASRMFGVHNFTLLRQSNASRRFGFTLHGTSSPELDQITQQLQITAP